MRAINLLDVYELPVCIKCILFINKIFNSKIIYKESSL